LNNGELGSMTGRGRERSFVQRRYPLLVFWENSSLIFLDLRKVCCALLCCRGDGGVKGRNVLEGVARGPQGGARLAARGSWVGLGLAWLGLAR
jgi:hypothetical protein